MARKVLGLTGNMGCGKSTVASLLSAHDDVFVIDTDSTARSIMFREEHAAKLEKEFGIDRTLEENDKRKQLAALLFRNPDKRRALERWIHPLVWIDVERQRLESNAEFVIIESALIFEAKMPQQFDGTIVVACSPDIQLARLRIHRGMQEDDIRARLRLQMPQEEKIARATFVISTDCTLEELKERVGVLYKTLKGEPS